jgi:hypothetical protein
VDFRNDGAALTGIPSESFGFLVPGGSGFSGEGVTSTRSDDRGRQRSDCRDRQHRESRSKAAIEIDQVNATIEIAPSIDAMIANWSERALLMD